MAVGIFVENNDHGSGYSGCEKARQTLPTGAFGKYFLRLSRNEAFDGNGAEREIGTAFRERLFVMFGIATRAGYRGAWCTAMHTAVCSCTIVEIEKIKNKNFK